MHRRKQDMYTTFWLESLKRRDHLENLHMDEMIEMIILKWILRKQVGGYGLDSSDSG
jgi:hypothetical protein